ncbi:unnamed protein product [Brassica rapa subsp. trilocularis]
MLPPLHPNQYKTETIREADAPSSLHTHCNRSPLRSVDKTEGRELLTRTHRREPSVGSHKEEDRAPQAVIDAKTGLMRR